MKRKSQKAQKKRRATPINQNRRRLIISVLQSKKDARKKGMKRKGEGEEGKRKVKRNARSGRAKPTTRLIKSARSRQQQQRQHEQQQQTEPSSKNNKKQRRRQLESTSRRPSAC